VPAKTLAAEDVCWPGHCQPGDQQHLRGAQLGTETLRQPEIPPTTTEPRNSNHKLSVCTGEDSSPKVQTVWESRNRRQVLAASAGRREKWPGKAKTGPRKTEIFIVPGLLQVQRKPLLQEAVSDALSCRSSIKITPFPPKTEPPPARISLHETGPAPGDHRMGWVGRDFVDRPVPTPPRARTPATSPGCSEPRPARPRLAPGSLTRTIRAWRLHPSPTGLAPGSGLTSAVVVT